MLQMSHQFIETNGITLSVYQAGPKHGRPVWMLHGFPECWYSWRHQVEPLTQAGYQVFVPEMRGYGQSSAPEAVDAYDVLTLGRDILGAMDVLGQQQAAIVGHDWGAMVAWYIALQAPERVSALATMSVPFAGRPKRPAIEIMRELAQGNFNYILYFQEPGLAEHELEADIGRTLKLLMYYRGKSLLQQEKPADSRMFDETHQVSDLPHWCQPDDLAVYEQTFRVNGFRGPLNWYRNFERNWVETEYLKERQISAPTLFLIGQQDPVKWMEKYTMEKMPNWVANLEQHVLNPCGHWIQNECAEQVNSYLLDFLSRNYSNS